jgi:hypothetical protein
LSAICFHFYRPDGGLFQSSFSAISLSEAEAGVTFRFSDLAVISSAEFNLQMQQNSD